MKMTRRDFLNVSTAAAVVCAATLLPVEKAAAAQQTLAAQNLLEQAYLYAFPLVIMELRGRFHKHPHSYKQQGPHQPVHPCGKAGRCNDPCGGYAECGYHLYAGVSGCRRRTNDLRRAADRPLF